MDEIGGSARLLVLDVTDADSIADAARQLEVLDILINNAGISLDTASAPDYTDVDTFRRTYETNVFGVAAVTNAFLPLLRRSAKPRFVHLVHAPGRAPSPMPLLLTHGWPGSFCEYLRLLPLLTDPGSHGADPADGLTADAVAGLRHRLVSDGLGYRSYVAHGSDLGAGVTARLARDHPQSVAAIHLATPGLATPPQPWSPAEAAYFAEVEAWTAEEGGYAHQQATKPATLGAALHDSPAGLAAWIGEKVVAWSSTTAGGQPAFDRDLLLGTLTLYWATGTITSSLQPYWAYRHLPAKALTVAGEPSPVPAAPLPPTIGVSC